MSLSICHNVSQRGCFRESFDGVFVILNVHNRYARDASDPPLEVAVARGDDVAPVLRDTLHHTVVRIRPLGRGKREDEKKGQGMRCEKRVRGNEESEKRDDGRARRGEMRMEKKEVLCGCKACVQNGDLSQCEERP